MHLHWNFLRKLVEQGHHTCIIRVEANQLATPVDAPQCSRYHYWGQLICCYANLLQLLGQVN